MLLELGAASFSLTAFSTTGLTSDETSLSLVCDENFGSGCFTECTQISPSRVSSPVSWIFSFLRFCRRLGIGR